MQFLRSILFLCLQALSAIFIFLAGLLLFAFPYRVRYKTITAWSHLTIWMAKHICGIHYQIKGLENIPKTNAIVLCKHQSAWETLFLQTLLPYQTWVLKRELLWIPFFGWGLSLLEPIAIDRSKSSSIKALLTSGKKRLEQGRWVIIFPEGSRIAAGATGRYSRSGAMLSQETGYCILPIAHNAGTHWPRQSFLKKPGIIQVSIGPIIDPSGLTLDEIHHQARDWIEHEMKNLPNV